MKKASAFVAQPGLASPAATTQPTLVEGPRPHVLIVAQENMPDGLDERLEVALGQLGAVTTTWIGCSRNILAEQLPGKTHLLFCLQRHPMYESSLLAAAEYHFPDIVISFLCLVPEARKRQAQRIKGGLKVVATGVSTTPQAATRIAKKLLAI